jgi:hypothetical protein
VVQCNSAFVGYNKRLSIALNLLENTFSKTGFFYRHLAKEEEEEDIILLGPFERASLCLFNDGQHLFLTAQPE